MLKDFYEHEQKVFTQFQRKLKLASKSTIQTH